MHTAFNPANPTIMETEALQGLVEELLAHPVISYLRIKLDGHEIPASRGFLKVIHEFRSNEDIIGDEETSNEGTLLRTD